MTIDFDAPTIPFPGDSAPNLKNGNSFFFTIRPRDGVDNAPLDLSDKLQAKILGCSHYHILVKEKTGLDSHFHFVMFMQSRITDVSNFKRSFGQARKSPLHFMFEDNPVPKGSEWHNFMHNGCVRQPYNTDVITEYLSGHLDKKADDPYEIISAHLPKDLDHLSPWLTDLSTIGRPAKQALSAWYVHYEKIFLEDHPDFKPPKDCHSGEGVSEQYLSQWYNDGQYKSRRFPILNSEKDEKFRIKRLMRFINQYDGPGYGSFDSTCRIETPSWGQLQLKRPVKSDSCPGGFVDDDRDFFSDNLTEAERREHNELCTGIS